MTHHPFQPQLARLFHNRTPRRGLMILLVLASLALAGCAESGQMAEQPRYDPLEASQFFRNGQSAQQLPEGVVPFAQNRDQSVFSQEEGERMSPNDPILTGVDESGNPVSAFMLPVDLDLVNVGRERYAIFCTPCHGPAGEGNGVAVGFGVAKPPSLLDTNSRGLNSGELFRIITEGQGKMYPYGYRVKPGERWAIIAYIRALQLKNTQSGPADPANPARAVDPASLTPAELQSIEGQP
jgi:hypothetical protein